MSTVETIASLSNEALFQIADLLVSDWLSKEWGSDEDDLDNIPQLEQLRTELNRINIDALVHDTVFVNVLRKSLQTLADAVDDRTQLAEDLTFAIENRYSPVTEQQSATSFALAIGFSIVLILAVAKSELKVTPDSWAYNLNAGIPENVGEIMKPLERIISPAADAAQKQIDSSKKKSP